MKRNYLFLLLALLAALLLLIGCEKEAVKETMPLVTLPVPTNGPPATATAAPPATGEEPVPVLETRNAAFPTVIGPAGNVYALYYRNVFGDSVLGDVDGDGRKELIYNSYGASDGDVLDAIFVYDLEDGWPVQEGTAAFSIGGARCELVEQEGQIFYSYQNAKLGYEEPLLLPVRAENGSVYLDVEELPEGLELTTNSVTIYGLSVRWLKERIGDRLLASEKNYVIWSEPGVLYAEGDTYGEHATYAAATTNGVTVTQRVGWYTMADGSYDTGANAKVDRADQVIGKTEQELIHLYGEPAFELFRSEDGFAALCWFTEKGKLLTVQIDGKATSATFTDLPIEDAP